MFTNPYPSNAEQLPSAVIYAREDELFDDRWLRWIASRLLDVDAIEHPGGHSPMLVHPALLANILERCADQAATA